LAVDVRNLTGRPRHGYPYPCAGAGVSTGTGSTPRRFVLLVEIAAGTIARILPDGTKTIVARSIHGPNGAAIDGKCYGLQQWRLQVACRRDPPAPNQTGQGYAGGIERIDRDAGTVECFHRTAAEVPLKGPNDILFDAQGGFYFTHLGKVRARDMDRGAVCYAKADGSFIASP
jgi:gluconolactonase